MCFLVPLYNYILQCNNIIITLLKRINKLMVILIASACVLTLSMACSYQSRHIAMKRCKEHLSNATTVLCQCESKCQHMCVHVRVSECVHVPVMCVCDSV